MGITSNRGQELGSGAPSMISLSHQSQRERQRERESEWEILYTWLLQHSIQAFLLIKEEEEKEGWLAYFALLALIAIHVTSLCTTTTHKETTSLLHLLCDHSFIHSFNNLCEMQTWLWVDSLSINCMCIVGGLLMLMLIHLAEIIQKFSSSPPPSPLAPNTIQASKQSKQAKQATFLRWSVCWFLSWGKYLR